MKYLLAITSLIFLLSSCKNIDALKIAGSDKSAANNPDQEVISTYQGGQVTRKDVNVELEALITKNGKLRGLTFDNLNADQKETLIKEAVLRKISYSEAKRRGLDRDKDYQEALRLFETELLKQKLFLTIAKEAADENNVRKNYDELVSKLKDKKDLRIRYIAVKTQSEAETLYHLLLKSPDSFVAQAKKKSLDKEIGKKGGDLGFLIEDALPTEVVAQSKLLNKGQIGMPIRAADKWIIIKLEDERPAEITPFEDAKDAMAQSLAKKAIDDFVLQNLEKAKISILVK